MEELVVLGGRNRTVGNNNVNEHSSRSHLVLQVHITSTDLATGYVQHGKLNLIDLAGSERIKVKSLNLFVKYCTRVKREKDATISRIEMGWSKSSNGPSHSSRHQKRKMKVPVHFDHFKYL